MCLHPAHQHWKFNLLPAFDIVTLSVSSCLSRLETDLYCNSSTDRSSQLLTVQYAKHIKCNKQSNYAVCCPESSYDNDSNENVLNKIHVLLIL